MIHTLAIELEGETPREFLLFRYGENATTKGPFYFTEASAREVMADYKARGVDLMIDLEHMSLDTDPSPDRTSKDARGWFGLELRDDGLYAVNVRWTLDGEERLRERRQRYISPAFNVKGRRVVSLINAALVAMPAMHEAPALIAASMLHDDEEMRSGLEALIAELAADAAPEDILSAVEAYLADWIEKEDDPTPDAEADAEAYAAHHMTLAKRASAAWGRR